MSDRFSRWGWLLALPLAACSNDGVTISGIPYDSDRDGVEDSVEAECPDAAFPIYPDGDRDGFGTDSTTLLACQLYQGWVDNADDCDDGAASVTTAETWYEDSDGDGLGDPARTTEACDAPDGYVSNGADPHPDCREADVDTCGVCDGPGPTWWYADRDDDGRGDDAAPTQACAPPPGFVAEGGDPEPDCATDDTDDCGVCGGGNADKDCAGVCDGGAAVDACGVCAGGTTGVPPIDDAGACGDGPDLAIDAVLFASSLSVETVTIDGESCALAQGCVGGTGERRVLRYRARVSNVGDADVALGEPPASTDDDADWAYAACDDAHTPAGLVTVTLASDDDTLANARSGGCMADERGDACAGYTCDDQGLSAGCATTAAARDCSWLDITDVEDGVYRLSVALDATRVPDDADRTNDTVALDVRITGDQVEPE